MTSTWALVVDAYRDLNSKKLFWLTLVISGLIVLCFAALGVNERGVTLLHWEIGDFGGAVNSATIPPAMLYKSMFSNFGIAFWLAWGASILALISTAGLIPSFVQGGAVELVLSKPVTRVRLFLTKFACGLLFTTLQVAIFTIACFLVIGLRGKAWEPSVFLAIPLVVIFFSYLYSICALIGLLTRSTIAALLLTLLAWFALFLVNFGDVAMVGMREAARINVESLEKSVARNERFATRQWEQLWLTRNAKDLPDGAAKPKPPAPSAAELDEAVPALREERQKLADQQRMADRMETFAKAAVVLKTVLPKTGETIELLSRTLRDRMNLPGDQAQSDAADADQPPGKAKTVNFWNQTDPEDSRRLQQRIDGEFKGRSAWWVLGTSLLFEAVVLGIACILFLRRDF
jgi:ABC-type transport system involved in multi-copper enzyme maturation permease subunit